MTFRGELPGIADPTNEASPSPFPNPPSQAKHDPATPPAPDLRPELLVCPDGLQAFANHLGPKHAHLVQAFRVFRGFSSCLPNFSPPAERSSGRPRKARFNCHPTAPSPVIFHFISGGTGGAFKGPRPRKEPSAHTHLIQADRPRSSRITALKLSKSPHPRCPHPVSSSSSPRGSPELVAADFADRSKSQPLIHVATYLQRVAASKRG